MFGIFLFKKILRLFWLLLFLLLKPAPYSLRTCPQLDLHLRVFRHMISLDERIDYIRAAMSDVVLLVVIVVVFIIFNLLTGSSPVPTSCHRDGVHELHGIQQAIPIVVEPPPYIAQNRTKETFR